MATPLTKSANEGRLQRVNRQVIQEEQGFGPNHEHVVNAHGHQVDTDCVELLGLGRQLDLAADAVGAGHENGVFVVFLEELLVVVQSKQAGKPIGQRDNAGSERTGPSSNQFARPSRRWRRCSRRLVHN